MNLNQLEVFVAIVDTGSLTEAAEVVGLTQSAVSHSLNRLEAELGVTVGKIRFGCVPHVAAPAASTSHRTSAVRCA